MILNLFVGACVSHISPGNGYSLCPFPCFIILDALTVDQGKWTVVFSNHQGWYFPSESLHGMARFDVYASGFYSRWSWARTNDVVLIVFQTIATFFSQVMAAVGGNTAGPGIPPRFVNNPLNLSRFVSPWPPGSWLVVFPCWQEACHGFRLYRKISLSGLAMQVMPLSMCTSIKKRSSRLWRCEPSKKQAMRWLSTASFLRYLSSQCFMQAIVIIFNFPSFTLRFESYELDSWEILHLTTDPLM